MNEREPSVFGIGETELVLILVFAFMIFGPDKLPGMGKTLGRALRQFRNAQEGFSQVVQTEIVDPATEAMSDTPKKPNRQRQANLDEDADIETTDGEKAAPKKSESFAERKRRLEAERKAAEAAASAEAAATEEASDADAAAAEGEQAAVTAAEAAEPVSAPAEPEAPKKPTAADLYSMKRPAKVEETPAAEAEPVSAPAEPAAQATEAPADANATKEA